MKFIQIFLAVLIVIGLGFLFTQGLWVPKLVSAILARETVPVAVTHGEDGSVCHQSTKYFVVERSVGGSVGSDVLVKYKTGVGQSFDCKYSVDSKDFELKNQDAEYFLTLTNNFLVLDSGTAPDPRGLIVYDLRNKQRVFMDKYSRPWSAAGDTLVYWSPVETKVTAQNCAHLAEYTSSGLGAVIEDKVSVNLQTLTKTVLADTRCSATQ